MRADVYCLSIAYVFFSRLQKAILLKSSFNTTTEVLVYNGHGSSPRQGWGYPTPMRGWLQQFGNIVNNNL